MPVRCQWVPNDKELYVKYHDEQWGVPVFDDRLLFEMLILEGAQAGLSWYTVLRKRENYIKAFDNFDLEKVARYSSKKIEKLLQNEGIIRNRLKIGSAIKNAQGVLKIRETHPSFSNYLWQFVDGKPIQNKWKSLAELPAKSNLSDKMSKELKRLGFSFVGSTICYSFMQAVGMINDHTVDCFRYKEIKNLKL